MHRQPDNPQCGSDFNCSVSNDGSLLLCLFACDPLLQDCEQDGTGCYWDLQQFNCDPTVGAIPTGETCGFINDCDVGNACLAPEATPGCAGSGCCAAFCNLSDPTCSIAETECTAFFTEGTAPPGLEDVGVCVLPAP